MVNANSKYLVLPCWNGLHADPYFLASLHSQVCDNRGHSARVKAEYDLFFKNRYLIKWNGHLLISHLAWTTRPGEFWAWPSIYSFRKMPSFKENQRIWNHRLFFLSPVTSQILQCLRRVQVYLLSPLSSLSTQSFLFWKKAKNSSMHTKDYTLAKPNHKHSVVWILWDLQFSYNVSAFPFFPPNPPAHSFPLSF